MTNALQVAFAEDHRVLIRGLAEVRDALQDQDTRRAKKAADDLDQKVGSHMRFEEIIFYPRLKKTLGSEFVSNLYREHATGRRAIADLLQLKAGEKLSPEHRQQLLDSIDVTLDHALSCGTLMSQADRLGETEQHALLATLKEMRADEPRWTQIPVVENAQ